MIIEMLRLSVYCIEYNTNLKLYPYCKQKLEMSPLSQLLKIDS